jgi:hypothetical protein
MTEINIPNLRSGIYIKPRESIQKSFLNELVEINKSYHKKKNFPKYKNEIRQLFQLQEPTLTNDTFLFLAGFIEGEGSINVGIQKNKNSKFKVYVDPQFSVTQHINGIVNLYLTMCYFKTGRIRYKSGSFATFVYEIDNRESLLNKVVPFYENYLKKFPSSVKERRVILLKMLLDSFNRKAHCNIDTMISIVLPLWDALRIQVGQKNQTFKDLEEAQHYVRQFKEGT